PRQASRRGLDPGAEVATRAEALHRNQKEVAEARAHGRLRDLDRSLVVDDERMRATDRRWIAADRRAVLVQGPRERVGLLHRGGARRPHITTPDVGVLGDDAQRPFGPVAADPDRRVRLLEWP